MLKRLQEGEIVALISDAGTPGISDPGMDLVRKLIFTELMVFLSFFYHMKINLVSLVSTALTKTRIFLYNLVSLVSTALTETRTILFRNIIPLV